MVTEQLQREFVDSNQSCFCRIQAVFAGPSLRPSGFRRNALGSSRASRHFSSFRIPPKFHRTQSYFLLRLSDETQERWDAAEPESVGPRLKARGEVLEARFFEFWKRVFLEAIFQFLCPSFRSSIRSEALRSFVGRFLTAKKMASERLGREFVSANCLRRLQTVFKPMILSHREVIVVTLVNPMSKEAKINR